MTMHYKFQQSFVEFYKVPQLQFIDRVVVFSVASQRQGSQCKLCKPVIPQCSSLRGSWHARCACRDSAENRGLRAVASIDKVVDFPVVQFVLVGCPVPGQGG